MLEETQELTEKKESLTSTETPIKEALPTIKLLTKHALTAGTGSKEVSEAEAAIYKSFNRSPEESMVH